MPKISELPASGAFNGAESFPLLKGGSTVQGSIGAVTSYGAVRTNTIWLAGDSLTAASYGAVGDNYFNRNAYGAFNWFDAFLGGVFNFRGSRASGGKTCRQMIDDQFPTIIAARPQYCWFTAGHNDIHNELVTPEVCYARIVEAVETLMKNGIIPIWSTIWGRSYDVVGTAKAVKTNDLLRRYAFSNPCGLFYDGALISTDPSSANCEGRLPLSSYYYDSTIHPNNLLAMIIGRYAAAQLSSRIAQPNFGVVGNESVTLAGGGNLLSNPGFVTTAAASATGVTGTIPAGWKVEWGTRTGTGSVACSIVSITDPTTGLAIAQGLQMVLSGAPSANDSIRLVQTDTENSALRTNLVGGSVVQGEVTMSVSGGSNMNRLNLMVQTNTNEATHWGPNGTSPVAYPATIPAMTMRTPEMVVLGSGAATQAQFQAAVIFNGAGTGTITWWRPRFRKVS